jgi:hypothetical protein
MKFTLNVNLKDDTCEGCPMLLYTHNGNFRIITQCNKTPFDYPTNEPPIRPKWCPLKKCLTEKQQRKEEDNKKIAALEERLKKLTVEDFKKILKEIDK